MLDDLISFQNSQSVHIHTGDCIDVLRTLPENHFHTCVTSPPYFGLRDYGMADQIGLEQTPDAFITKLVEVFREVRRVLREDGTLWLNLGDSYCGSGYSNHTNTGGAQRSDGGKQRPGRTDFGIKAKDLLMIPPRVAIALQTDGWWLRSAIVFQKPNPMPESVRDRPTSSYEMVYLLAKSETYYYDAKAIMEPATNRASGNTHKRWGNDQSIIRAENVGQVETMRGIPWRGAPTRNARNVWTITPKAFKGAHFATMAPELARRCILAGCPEGGQVLDPFGGAGTTGLVAGQLNRRATLIELNPDYAEIARSRLGDLYG